MSTSPGLMAQDVMTSPPFIINEEASLADVARSMLEKQVGSLIVVDESGVYKGLITERLMLPQKGHIPFNRGEIFKVLAGHIGSLGELMEVMKQLSSRPVSEFAKGDVPTTHPTQPIDKVADTMMVNEVHHLPVIDKKRPVGMISRHDFLKVYTQKNLDS